MPSKATRKLLRHFEAKGPMRVWWIPQVPGKPFHVEVATVAEALKVIDILAKYDLFQFENRIKPDYANTGGLEVFENGEWSEWCDEDTGDTILEVKRKDGA